MAERYNNNEHRGSSHKGIGTQCGHTHTHTHHVPAHRSSGSPHRDRSLSSCVTLPNIPILVSITRNACMYHPRHTNRPSLFVLFPAQSECMQHSNRVTLSHDGHQGLHHLVNARCFWVFGSTADTRGGQDGRGLLRVHGDVQLAVARAGCALACTAIPPALPTRGLPRLRC